MTLGGKMPPAERMRFSPETNTRLRKSGVPLIVTGAGGWLGRAALEMLDSAFDEAVGTRVMGFARTSRTIRLRSGRLFDVQPLNALERLEIPKPIILHCAFLTREYAQQMPVETYIAKNREISRIVQATIYRNGMGGVFIPSSGAVYGPDRTIDDELTVNPYGVLKYQDEITFTEMASRYRAPFCIMRVFNVAGPFINKGGSYALGSIIEDIARGGPISLSANNLVWRSYAHVADILNIAMGMLSAGISAPPFDTAGEAVVEIGDLARRAVLVLGKDGIAIERPAIRDGFESSYVGDGGAYFDLATRLGITPKPLDRQIIDTAAYIGSSN